MLRRTKTLLRGYAPREAAQPTPGAHSATGRIATGQSRAPGSLKGLPAILAQRKLFFRLRPPRRKARRWPFPPTERLLSRPAGTRADAKMLFDPDKPFVQLAEILLDLVDILLRCKRIELSMKRIVLSMQPIELGIQDQEHAAEQCDDNRCRYVAGSHGTPRHARRCRCPLRPIYYCFVLQPDLLSALLGRRIALALTITAYRKRL